jgi:hypothetical protein
MRRQFRLLQLPTALFVIALVIGCSSPDREPDADALVLREMVEKVFDVSGIDEPVLRQLFVNPYPNPNPDNTYFGSHGFLVTDRDATFGVEIIIGTPDQPSNEWRIIPIEFIRYEADVYLDIDSLNAGPKADMSLATRHWTECKPRSQSLVGSSDGSVWVVFCDLPEGTVSGWVDAETGEFTPSKAPPAIAPGIATTEV